MRKILLVTSLLVIPYFNVSLATIITVPLAGQIYEITDPDNLLSLDLGLGVNVGDSFSASFTLDDAVSPYSVSLGSIYNFLDPSIMFNASFGAGGSVSDLNNAYRLTILDNYDSGDYGTLDIWSVAAAIGIGVDSSGNNYLNILNFEFVDTSHSLLNDTSLYFEDSTLGWEFSGISIRQWYADLDDRNNLLLTTIPLTKVPTPPIILLLMFGIPLVYLTKKGSRVKVKEDV